VAFYLLPKTLSVDTLVDFNEVFLLVFTIVIAIVLPLSFLYFDRVSSPGPTRVPMRDMANGKINHEKTFEPSRHDLDFV
jgi:hypothetical protein